MLPEACWSWKTGSIARFHAPPDARAELHVSSRVVHLKAGLVQEVLQNGAQAARASALEARNAGNAPQRTPCHMEGRAAVGELLVLLADERIIRLREHPPQLILCQHLHAMYCISLCSCMDWRVSFH